MANLYQYLTENYEENEPIFTSEIQIEGITENNIRQQFKKLTDAEKLKRYDKGIYYLPRKSIFRSGSKIALEKVLEYKYMRNSNNSRCGYISGLLFFNQMGLTTQVPMQYEIVTNRASSEYREITLAKSRVIIRKPKVFVDDDNYTALQFLDMMKDVDVYSELEGSDLQKSLYQYMYDVNLKISDLEPYFSYYPNKLYKNLIETKVIYHGILAS